MIKIDLVTGFLGSGKTTFIRRYAQYLMAAGKRITILENDYGAINVDMMMLEDLEGDQCDLQMVVGGSDYDCHKRRLKSKLITLGMLGYDRVIMEPSGIFDVDEFTDTLREDPLDRWYEIGSVITIVDAFMKEELSPESEYLIVSQTADAGAVVLSRTQNADEAQKRAVIDHINRAFDRFRCSRTLGAEDLILVKPWDQYTHEDYERILQAGFVHADHIKMPVTDDNEYDSMFYMNVRMKEAEIRPTIEKMLSDADSGRIIRIKGYISVKEPGVSMSDDGEGLTGNQGMAEAASGVTNLPEEDEEAAAPRTGGGETAENCRWIEINATSDEIQTQETARGQEVVIVIGENLNRDRIAEYLTFSYGSGHEFIRRE